MLSLHFSRYVFFILILITLFWLGGALVYLDDVIGLDNVTLLEPRSLGLFIAGTLMPVMLLWIGLSSYHRSVIISVQLSEMCKASRQAAEQSASMHLTESHLKLDTFLNLAGFYLQHMGKEAAVLADCVFEFDEHKKDSLWLRYSQGDTEVFFRIFFEITEEEIVERLANICVNSVTASRSAHLFSGYYQIFLRHAENIDHSTMLLESYRNGHAGALSRVVNQALYGQENPFNEDQGARSRERVDS